MLSFAEIISRSGFSGAVGGPERVASCSASRLSLSDQEEKGPFSQARTERGLRENEGILELLIFHERNQPKGTFGLQIKSDCLQYLRVGYLDQLALGRTFPVAFKAAQPLIEHLNNKANVLVVSSREQVVFIFESPSPASMGIALLFNPGFKPQVVSASSSFLVQVPYCYSLVFESDGQASIATINHEIKSVVNNSQSLTNFLRI